MGGGRSDSVHASACMCGSTVNAMLIEHMQLKFCCYLLCMFVEKYSAQRIKGLRALFEHFQPTLLSYDEVNRRILFELLEPKHTLQRQYK